MLIVVNEGVRPAAVPRTWTFLQPVGTQRYGELVVSQVVGRRGGLENLVSAIWDTYVTRTLILELLVCHVSWPKSFVVDIFISCSLLEGFPVMVVSPQPEMSKVRYKNILSDYIFMTEYTDNHFVQKICSLILVNLWICCTQNQGVNLLRRSIFWNI